MRRSLSKSAESQEEGKTRTAPADIIFHMQQNQQKLSLVSWTVQPLNEMSRNLDATPSSLSWTEGCRR
ncbi:hypothetical protein Pmani_028622 [Petrolisthes manimaculis]|uniref:Uncharacterized protein n=1 Tax=Petrolisthes manimaculis TaxID=1843537 RepID=A0AAE1NZ50_9EUCA|nr:hypothetical protein Pmani_028622 [Petrolisthes manimaculis]